MVGLRDEWGVEVDRGPDWLFLRLQPGANPTGVADKLWSLADRHFTYRLVLEMEDVDVLPSDLMGQLVVLQKRVLQRHGALRLCGLSDQCAQAIHFCRLDQALPNYDNREEAVKGARHSNAL